VPLGTPLLNITLRKKETKTAVIRARQGNKRKKWEKEDLKS